MLPGCKNVRHSRYLVVVDCPPERKPIVRLDAKTAERADSSLCTAVGWNQLTFAKDGVFHHWICGVKRTKTSANLCYHFGGLLDDSKWLLSVGASKFGRWLRVLGEADSKTSTIKVFSWKAERKPPCCGEN